jgi:hypothetical protein
VLLAVIGAGGLLACAEDAAPVAPNAEWTVADLARLSLDLRGVRPTLAELEAAEADAGDPTEWSAAVDTFLRDPRFGPRVRDLFADIYRTRQDGYLYEADDYGLSDPADFVRSIGEEPLRMLSTVAEEDLPYTDIVRADWTVADAALAAMAPLDYPADATGWQRAHYTDGRPAAGILATNGLWWRYTTTLANAGRGRANALTRILLCHDALSRPVPFDRTLDLLDPAAVSDALDTNPGCVACHLTLDPLASFLYGFQPVPGDGPREAASYHPDREPNWASVTGVAPAYYGTPADGLADLAVLIADDPRLTTCVTQQVYAALEGREVTFEDTGPLVTHHAAFVDAGLTLRGLFRSIVEAAPYRGEGRTKLLSVEQLGTTIEALTTFRFTHLGFDLLQSETYGVRSLADGVDGLYASRPNAVPTATAVLVHARVTQAAAAHVVAHDRADPATAALFTEVDFTETPASGRAAMVAQVQALRARVHGARVDADGEEVEADLALWSELYALDGDPADAWAGVLSVLMREPTFLLY